MLRRLRLMLSRRCGRCAGLVRPQRRWFDFAAFHQAGVLPTHLQGYIGAGGVVGYSHCVGAPAQRTVAGEESGSWALVAFASQFRVMTI